MDFLPAFFGTGLFVVVGIFVAMAVAFVCGVPFDLGRFVVACALGGVLGTVLLLWASFFGERQSVDEKMETLVACVLWWAALAGLTFLLMFA